MSSGSIFSRLVRPAQQESLLTSVNEPEFQITFNRLANSQDQQPNRRSSGAGGSIFNRLVRKPQADGAEESFGDDFGASEADDQVVAGYVKPAFASFSYNGADDSNTRGRGSMAYQPASEQSVKTRLIRQARSRSRSPTTNRNQRGRGHRSRSHDRGSKDNSNYTNRRQQSSRGGRPHQRQQGSDRPRHHASAQDAAWVSAPEWKFDSDYAWNSKRNNPHVIQAYPNAADADALPFISAEQVFSLTLDHGDANSMQDGAPCAVYQPRQGEFKSVLHWGKRRQLLSEIDFITRHGYPHCHLVYASVYPGSSHMSLLTRLFPDITIHVFAGDDSESISTLRDNARVKIYREVFSDEWARKFCHTRALFLCAYLGMGSAGISSAAGARESDMEQQARWTTMLQPHRAMLRFQLPWRAGQTQYLYGELRLPIWASPTTAETYLICDGESTQIRTYDHTKYEQQMHYFNTHTRCQLFEHDIDCSQGNSGLDHCFDCRAEIEVLRNFLQWQAKRELAVELDCWPSYQFYSFVDPDNAAASSASPSSSSSSDSMLGSMMDEDDEATVRVGRRFDDSSSSSVASESSTPLPPLTWDGVWSTLIAENPRFAERFERIHQATLAGAASSSPITTNDFGEPNSWPSAPANIRTLSAKLTAVCGLGKRTLAMLAPAATNRSSQGKSLQPDNHSLNAAAPAEMQSSAAASSADDDSLIE